MKKTKCLLFILSFMPGLFVNLQAQVKFCKLAPTDSSIYYCGDVVSYKETTLFSINKGLFVLEDSFLIPHYSNIYTEDDHPTVLKIFKNTLYNSVPDKGISYFNEKTKKWVRVTTGLTDSLFWELHVCGNYLFAVSNESGIFRTSDGRNWESLEGTRQHSIEVDAGDDMVFIKTSKMFVIDNAIYSATGNAGIYKSIDFGSTWTWLIAPFKSGDINGMCGLNGQVYFSYFGDREKTGIYHIDSTGTFEKEIDLKGNYFLTLMAGDNSNLYYYLIDRDIDNYSGSLISHNVSNDHTDVILPHTRTFFVKKIKDSWFIADKRGFVLTTKNLSLAN